MRTIARRALTAAFGTAATLTLAVGVAGCGGAASDSSDATVVTESGVPVTSAAPAAPTGAAASPAPAAAPAKDAAVAPTTAGAAPAMAGGWGTFKGQVVFGGSAPAQEVLFAKGQAAKDPTICGKDAPTLSERLIVDGATKGV